LISTKGWWRWSNARLRYIWWSGANVVAPTKRFSRKRRIMPSSQRVLSDATEWGWKYENVTRNSLELMFRSLFWTRNAGHPVDLIVI
jgi:hypothetical protein